MRRPPGGTRASWGGYHTCTVWHQREMDNIRNSLVHINSSLDPIPDLSESEIPGASDTRPSILITFQNSASYYTSYMGGGGMRGAATRPKSTDVVNPQQQKGHPIVVMNDYPTPAPVCVTVNSRKQSCDHGFLPFSGPPAPQGPPGPPGPPIPNLPSSRRESFASNTLELPKKRRGSATPSVASRSQSPSERLLSTRPRTPVNTNLPLRSQARLDHYDTASLPRPFKPRPPTSSLSMPALAEATDFPSMEVPLPSPRPSVCSSAMTDGQGERRPLMYEPRSLEEAEEQFTPPQPKPNWLSLNIEGNEGKNRTQSVYVAEIWPSLVCVLTAVVMTLIIYILVSYFYSTPHPVTRDRIAPRPTVYPAQPTPYPYPYPYIPPPPPYDRYPHYQPQYPQQPPPTNP